MICWSEKPADENEKLIGRPAVLGSSVVLSVRFHHVDGMSCKFECQVWSKKGYFSSSDDKWRPAELTSVLNDVAVMLCGHHRCAKHKNQQAGHIHSNTKLFPFFILKHFTYCAQSKFTRIQTSFDFHCTLLTMQFLLRFAFCLSELHHRPKNFCFPPNHDFKRNRCRANKPRGARIQF